MEKKIENYLHLYLGCEVDMSLATTKYEGGITTLTTNILADYVARSIKPILRKLSDMTEDEFKISGLKTHPKFWMTDSSIWCFTAEITRYLLSKAFDLFGLIESGLAIDATKQLTKPQ